MPETSGFSHSAAINSHPNSQNAGSMDDSAEMADGESEFLPGIDGYQHLPNRRPNRYLVLEPAAVDGQPGWRLIAELHSLREAVALMSEKPGRVLSQILLDGSPDPAATETVDDFDRVAN